MDLLVTLLVGALLGLGCAVLVLRARRGTPDDLSLLSEELRRLATRVSDDTALLHQRLEGIDSRMTHTQTSNREMAQGIFETLGDLRNATNAVAEHADRFTDLQDLLRAPKARGGIGEAMLEELLRQVLPPSAYEMQYRFTSGTIVDAVVRAGGKIICIDSKFPLANFQRICDGRTEAERLEAERAFARDVERHIHDISVRYVVPDEGTLDFAVMYVPAEGVYGEVLRLSHRRVALSEIAIAHRVIPMSPLTMYGYLQTVLFGLRCLQIEKNAERMLGYCGRLQQDVERFAEDYETLGRHLGNARGKYEDGTRRLDRFKGTLERVVDLADDDAPAAPSLEIVGE